MHDRYKSRSSKKRPFGRLARKMLEIERLLAAHSPQTNSAQSTAPYLLRITDDAKPSAAEAELIDGQRHSRMTSPGLPSANYVRHLIRQRKLRDRAFGAGLFADPVWDMLLDLTVAEIDGKRISVTSLCLASNVPSTTALRWINTLIDAGLISKKADEIDRRRSFLSLTEKAIRLMAQYFDQAIKPAF